MALRNDYFQVQQAVQGFGGTQNSGVYVVLHRTTNTTCIEKRVAAKQNGAESVEHEIRTMKQVKGHPNIVSILEYDTDDIDTTYASIYMQHCELGSLDSLIGRFAQRDLYLEDEGFLWKVLWDVSLALCYLWTGHDYEDTRQRALQGQCVDGREAGWNAIIHRDMKPGNIFMTWWGPQGCDPSSVYPIVVLADFGCSVTSTDILLNTKPAQLLRRGRVCFDPPEPRYTKQADVYGIGLIMHCLALMQQLPCGSVNEREATPFGEGHGFCEGLEEAVQKCLIENPSSRPTPEGLPKMVWEAYWQWRSARSNDGQSLPGWTFG
ncbi:kinase-like protein [Decorospora gaudefroyi]|uniref:non-specific serine/threonine protein kinase n=1 Tax=Decorospora gaudefroyi TaxID=184978 RepID=A0A6A5KCZ4_9PLEO|nr:kinase-like protein [Decorospora gaudefroyi]